MKLELKKQLPEGMTINTDASWHPALKIAAYAFTVANNHARIRQAGLLTGTVSSPLEAEILCIKKALETVHGQHFGGMVKWLVLNTDSEQAMLAIMKDKRKTATEVRRLLKSAQDRLGIEQYEFRHVKAHSGVPDKRSEANRWCDRSARKKLREEVRRRKDVAI